ncbi:phage integrase N-terminal SAM-like domain-containing protein [Candidatus Desantisbacteria bacterium]|nr:phage integrase N-terminal SAM-like domain-containing protein [Candidatus Desantisbacteria bacterium]
MGKLREQMERDLAIKRFSQKTQKTYLACVRNFAGYFNKSPDLMGREEVKKYLQFLIEEKNYSS